MHIRTPFFYGWVIVAFIFLMLLISNGLGISGLTVFDKLILAEFSINVGQLKSRELITLLVSGTIAPFLGMWVDKVGVRPVITIGAVLFAAGLFGYSLSDNIGHIYWLHILIGAGMSCLGLVVGVSIVSKWFIYKRGLAMGIVLAGTSMGGAILPHYGLFLLEDLGLSWRESYPWISILPLILIPLVWIFIKDAPSDIGEKTYGEEQGLIPTQSAISGMYFKDAIKSLNFWLLTVIAMLTFYSILAYASHLFLHMTNEGFERKVAGSGITALFTLGIIGKLLSGAISERIGHRKTMVSCLLLMFVGSVLFTNPSDALLWPAILTVGLGWGGLYTMIQLTCADIFGRRDIGKLIGAITILDAYGGALGPWVTGILFDKTGGYQFPFIVISTFIFIALVCSTLIRVPKHEAEGAA